MARIHVPEIFEYQKLFGKVQSHIRAHTGLLEPRLELFWGRFVVLECNVKF
jgi:hypothetical protein